MLVSGGPGVSGGVALPAEAASTLALASVVVPEADVPLVQGRFAQTTLEGGGAQRCGALTPQTELLPAHTNACRRLHLHVLPGRELPAHRYRSKSFCPCLESGLDPGSSPLPQGGAPSGTPADGPTETHEPQT